MSENEKKELRVNIPQQIQGGVFSNAARVNITAREVVIDFAFMEPNNPNQAILVSRIILTKEHTLDLKNVLERVLKDHEGKKGVAEK